MSNELQTISPNQQVVLTDADLILHLENLGLLKSLTVGEKNTYLQVCKAFNLNPFKREVHVSKYKDQMSIITGYETYIKRAERSGVLDGWDVITTGSVDGNDLKAIITIYRKDRTRPFVWSVNYNEYVQRTSEGHVNKFWKKAETMTKKVAMAQGFRLCFNDELGGMPYTADEMGTTEEIHHTEVATPTSAPIAATVVKKQTLPAKGLTDSVARIVAGELELFEKIVNAFELTPAQLSKLIESQKTILNGLVKSSILGGADEANINEKISLTDTSASVLSIQNYLLTVQKPATNE